MARALRCPSVSLVCSLRRSKQREREKEAGAAECSVERGGEAFWLFKGTNKLICEAPLPLRYILGEREPLFTRFLCCAVKQGEGGQSILQGRILALALAEGFDPVFIGTAHWAPGPFATLTQKSAGFQYSQTPLLINFILAGKCSLARWVTFTLKGGLKQLNTQIAPPSMWQPCILKKNVTCCFLVCCFFLFVFLYAPPPVSLNAWHKYQEFVYLLFCQGARPCDSEAVFTAALTQVGCLHLRPWLAAAQPGGCSVPDSD